MLLLQPPLKLLLRIRQLKSRPKLLLLLLLQLRFKKQQM
jgi:hypothetical protein